MRLKNIWKNALGKNKLCGCWLHQLVTLTLVMEEYEMSLLFIPSTDMIRLIAVGVLYIKIFNILIKY